MADTNETIRLLRVKATSEGMDSVTQALDRLGKSYRTAADGAGVLSVSSDTVAKSLPPSVRQMEALAARLDPAEKAAQQFARGLNQVARAAEGGYFDRFADGAERVKGLVTSLQREFEKLGASSKGMGAGIGGISTDGAEQSARAIEEIYRAKATQIGQEFARELNLRLVEGSGKAARDSAAAMDAEFNARDMARSTFDKQLGVMDWQATGSKAGASASVFMEAYAAEMAEVARHKGQWVADQFTQELNQRLVAGTGKSARESADAFEAAFTARDNAQSAFNQQLGVKPWQAQGSQASASASAFMDADAESARRLRVEYDQLAVALERRDAAIKEANALVARTAITEQQHTNIVAGANRVYHDTERALKRTGVAVDKYSNGMGLARHEMINFSRQAQDVFVSLASGQAPLTVLIQQGTQIADIFSTSKGTVAGFFGQLFTGAARFAASLAGVTTGIVAFGVAGAAAGMQYASGQKEVERSLAGVGKQSGLTLAAINRMSEGYANAASVSVASSREMIAAFAKTGVLRGGEIGATAGLTRDFAAQTGQSKGDAAKQLAESFRDPTKAVQEFNKELGFLDAKTLEYIRTAQAQGRVGDAQRAMAQALGESVRGAADRTTGLAKAWNAVWNAASNAWDALGRATSGQSTLEERLNNLILIRQRLQGSRRPDSVARAATADAGITDLQEQIRRQNQQADRDARNARSRAASLPGMAALDELNTYGAEIRKLEKMASDLGKALKEGSESLNPQQAREMAEAYERVQRAIQMTLPPAERQRQENAITVRAIEARTVAERTAVELARQQLDSSFKLKETEEQRLILLGKINEMQAQANREARDAARSARDTLEMAGMRPYQRRQQQIANEQRDLRERAGGAAAPSYSFGAGGYTGEGPFTNGGALPATTGVLRNMDAAFAANLKRAMDDIPGLKITSGWRSMERQAQLQQEKPGWAASPTGSNHPKGFAADLSYNGSGQLSPELRARLERDYGLAFPLANRSVKPEPWHAEPAGLRSGNGMVGATNNGLIASAGADKQAANDLETYNSIVRSANDNLRAQQAQFEATRATLYMTNEEVVKAQKYQELYNQAVQEGGVDLANKLSPALAKTAAGYGELARQQEQLQRSQEAMKTVGDLGRQTITGFYSDLRNGVSGAEMFRNALDRIASKLLDMATNDLFGKAFGNNSQGLFGGGGFFSGIGNFFGGGFGGGSGLGTTPGSGGLYADGGFTGHGSKWQPAGIVHRGEVVWSQADVSRAGGVGVVDAMRRGLPGYASGGAPGYSSPPSAAAANSNAPRSPVNVYTAPGMTAETKEREDGGLDVYIDQAEGQMARKVARNKGPLSFAIRQAGNSQNLRG